MVRPAYTSSAAAGSTCVLPAVDDELKVLEELLEVTGVVELLVVFDGGFVTKIVGVVVTVELVVLGAMIPRSTSGAALLLSPSAKAETDAPD